MEKLKFTPERGYEDSIYYPDPTSEEQTRAMMMDMPNQIKAYVNDVLIEGLGDQVTFTLVGNRLSIKTK